MKECIAGLAAPAGRREAVINVRKGVINMMTARRISSAPEGIRRIQGHDPE